MREPISIQVFIYRVSGDTREYLLFKRVKRSDLGLSSFWQGITGGVEQGEDIKQAATREISEEAGLKVPNLSESVYSYSFPMKTEWRPKYPEGTEVIHEHVFVMQSDKDPILSDEHTEFGWFEYPEAISMLGFAESKKALCCIEGILGRS